jgi:hypothetical protein
MPKPARIVVPAVGAVVLVVALAVLGLRDKRPIPAPPAAPRPVAAVTPSAPAPAPAAVNPPQPPPATWGAGQKLRKPAVVPEGGKHLDEASLLAKLHDLAASDPPLSLQLARDAVSRFPDSPNAPEFAWNVTKALVNMGRRAEAEEEARGMVKKYPGNYFAGDVEHHLLNHPPNPK